MRTFSAQSRREYLQAIVRIWQRRPWSHPHLPLRTCWHSLESPRTGHGVWTRSRPLQDWRCQGQSCSPYSDWIVFALTSTKVLVMQVRPKVQARNRVSQTPWRVLWLDVAMSLPSHFFLAPQNPSLNLCMLSMCNLFLTKFKSCSWGLVRLTANLRLDKLILKSTGAENFSTFLKVLRRQIRPVENILPP